MKHASKETEAAVLGSILTYPEGMDAVADRLHFTDFTDFAHQMIWNAAKTLHDAGQVTTLHAVRDVLRERDDLEPAGGVPYLIELVEGSPVSVVLNHDADRLISLSHVRRLVKALEQAEAIIDEGQLDTADTAARIERVIADNAEDRRVVRRETTAGAIAKSLLERERDEQDRSLSTGLRGLDDMVDGLRRGEVAVIGARPSMGKTALGCSVAVNVLEGGTPVGFISAEMGQEALTTRMLAAMTGLGMRDIMCGRLSHGDRDRLRQAAEQLGSPEFFISHPADRTISRVRSMCRTWARDGAGLIIIDHLRLLRLDDPGKKSPYETTTEISGDIQMLAAELNVPIVLLAQLNRGGAQHKGKSESLPRMSDLRDSGAVEENADIVALLHREAYYHKDDPEWFASNPEDLSLLLVDKNRNGETGTVKLRFDAPTCRFTDWEEVEKTHAFGNSQAGGAGVRTAVW